MKTKETFYWYFLRWLLGFGDFIDGICLIITFGFYCPNLGLKISFEMAVHSSLNISEIPYENRSKK